MKRYDTYKDSGIEWFGAIPRHWTLSKAKHMFHLVNDNVTDPTLPKVALENIESGTGRYIKTESDFMGEGVEFIPNDILFGKLRPYLAKVYKADFRGQSVGDIYVFRGKESQDADYLKFLMLSHPFISVVDGSTYGAKMPRANWDFISQMILPNPPLSEQHIIASYLDDKVGQIDAVIAEKEKMVEDLQNYRKSVISEAVTRGLNPDVPMKDSGIDKFPQIPSHWNSLKLKYMSTISSGGALPSDQLMNDGEYEVYGGNGCMGLTSRYNTEAPAIIIGRVGALCGNIHLINSPKWVTDNALVLAIKGDASYEYVAYYLQAYDLNTLNSSNAQPLITGTKVLNVQIPIPSLEEQSKIVDYLNNIYFTMDTAISELQSQIEDLKSYKSSLITEAVTGKIDLR